MPFATTAAIVGGLAAAGSIGGAAIASHGAGKQADAAMSAAQLQHQDAQDALAFQKQEYSDQQKNIAPWLQAGQGAITSLSDMLNKGEFKDWTGSFQAPTGATEQNDPGYQFRLAEGQKALERSAAAKGNLLTGGTAKAEQAYGQNYASNEYQNVYNRSLQQYQQGYNEFENNQANKFNRYAAIAGVGQTAAGQLNSAGSSAAGNISSILLNSGQQIGNDLQNAGAARASGYNAYAGALNSTTNTASQLYLMKQLGYLG